MTSFIAYSESGGLRAGHKGLQQLLHEPLSVLTQWYNDLRDGDRQKEEEISLALLPGTQTPPPRLHEGAESYHSSLRAGTASIVINYKENGSLNFLNLPVSSS